MILTALKLKIILLNVKQDLESRFLYVYDTGRFFVVY